MTIVTGVVKWFDNDRWYGFISCNEGNDVFVHQSQIKERGPEKDLHEGECVAFDKFCLDAIKIVISTGNHYYCLYK